MIIPDGIVSDLVSIETIHIDIGGGILQSLLIHHNNEITLNPLFNGKDIPDPTPTPTYTMTGSPLPSPTPSLTISHTPTQTHSMTSTQTYTPSDTITYSPTLTTSSTPTLTPSQSPSATPTESFDIKKTVRFNEKSEVEVSVEEGEDGNNNLIFNGNTPYDPNRQFEMSEGNTYTFKVPESHPIRFYSDPPSAFETGGDVAVQQSIMNSSHTRDFYTGIVKLTIKGPFNSGSYECQYHGSMGGDNKLKHTSEPTLDKKFKDAFPITGPDDVYSTLQTDENYIAIMATIVTYDGNGEDKQRVKGENGILYAFTETYLSKAIYTTTIHGTPYYCVGVGHGNDEYNDGGNIRNTEWGYYFTTLMSVQLQPAWNDVVLLFVEADSIDSDGNLVEGNVYYTKPIDELTDIGNYEGKYHLHSAGIQDSESEYIDVKDRSTFLQVEKDGIYTPMILNNETRTQSNINILASVDNTEIVIDQPNVAFEVNYSEYAYHSIVYATVKNDGKYVVELGDVMTASDPSDNIRGVSSTVIYAAGDKPMFVMQLYSNTSGSSYENIIFKFMKHKTSLNLQGNRLYVLDNVLMNGGSITNDAPTSYTEDNPLTFNFGVIHSVVNGPYDYLSVDVATTNMNFVNVFGSFIDHVVAVRSKSSITFKSNNMWIGNITDIKTDQFYIVKTDGSGPFVWKFEAKLIPEIIQPIIRNGFNWISYPLSFETGVSRFITEYIDELAPYVSEITSQNGILIKSNGSWFGNLTSFTPNNGYIMHVKNLPAPALMSYPNSSIDYKKINNDIATGVYNIKASGIPFLYDDIIFNIIDERKASLTIIVDGTAFTARFDSDSANESTWSDKDFISLAPTNVETKFSPQLKSMTASETQISVSDVQFVMSYTLEMFNGQYNLVMNGYLDFFGVIGEVDPMTGYAGDSSWLSEIERHTFNFVGVKNNIIILPETPTAISEINYGNDAPLLQLLNNGNTVDIFLNTTGQASGVAGFDLQFINPVSIIGAEVNPDVYTGMVSSITGATMNPELQGSSGWSIRIERDSVIGTQASDNVVEVRTSTKKFITLQIEPGSFSDLDVHKTKMTDAVGDDLDMSSIRPTSTPTPTMTYTPTITSSPNTEIDYTTRAPMIQVIVSGTMTEVYINTHGQSSGFAGFQFAFNKGIQIDGDSVQHHGDTFTVSNGDNIVMGMQFSSNPVEVRFDTVTKFLSIPVTSESMVSLKLSDSYLTDKDGDNLAPVHYPTTHTITYTPSPTVTLGIDYTTYAPIIQVNVDGTNTDVYINTHGQSSGFAGFQFAFDEGIQIDGDSVQHHGDTFTISNGDTVVMGMQFSGDPDEVRFDTVTKFLSIPITSGSIVSLKPSESYLTDKNGDNLDMTSMSSRKMLSKTYAPGDVMGDITGDGTCNISDVQRAISEIFTPGTLTELQRTTADINNDSIVNVTDIQLMIQIVFGTFKQATPTPSGDTISTIYRRVLSDGFELHANDDVSILYFTRNGDILLEILPELGNVVERDIEIPSHCALMRLTKDWNIVYPVQKVADYTKMDLRFLYKGTGQSVVTPMLSSTVVRSSIFASLWFSVNGYERDAFWAITTSGKDGVKFWFREEISTDWVSQIQIGSATMAGYVSIIRKIDVEDDVY